MSNKMLKVGETFTSVTGTHYAIEQYLQSGTQGEIYKVISGDGNIYALKVYFPKFAQSSHLYDDINNLTIKIKCPSSFFVWPRELAVFADTFGYIMPFVDLKQTNTIFEEEYLLDRKLAATICLNIATAMQALHLHGMCYKDLSHNNFEYNPKNGDVVIFDCDNINPKGTKCTVSGTLGYRAPEIILAQKYPDDLSDIYSMAIIFFKLWMGSDISPFEGKIFYDMFDGILDNGILDGVNMAERYLYGTNPIFIFDPNDTSNALDAQDPHDFSKINLWKYFIPEELKNLFIETFTKGLSNPQARPADGRWIACFKNILQNITTCKDCNFNNTNACEYCLNCLKPLK